MTDVGRALFRRIDHDARDAGITHAVTAGGRRSRRRSMQQRIRRRGAVSEQRRHNVDVIIVVDIVVVAAVVTTAIVAIASPPRDLTHRVDRVVTVAIVIIIVDKMMTIRFGVFLSVDDRHGNAASAVGRRL